MKVGDQVWFTGKFTKTRTMRGVVEVIQQDVVGVRRENGNFSWTLEDKLEVRQHGPQIVRETL